VLSFLRIPIPKFPFFVSSNELFFTDFFFFCDFFQSSISHNFYFGQGEIPVGSCFHDIVVHMSLTIAEELSLSSSSTTAWSSSSIDGGDGGDLGHRPDGKATRKKKHKRKKRNKGRRGEGDDGQEGGGGSPTTTFLSGNPPERRGAQINDNPNGDWEKNRRRPQAPRVGEQKTRSGSDGDDKDMGRTRIREDL